MGKPREENEQADPSEENEETEPSLPSLLRLLLSLTPPTLAHLLPRTRPSLSSHPLASPLLSLPGEARIRRTAAPLSLSLSLSRRGVDLEIPPPLGTGGATRCEGREGRGGDGRWGVRAAAR